MAAQEEWARIKGVLIHRCVLAAAGKPLMAWQARKTPKSTGLPTLVSEAQWIANQLETALRDGDRETAWPLIDAGGPLWTKEVANFNELADTSEREAERALENLAEIAERASRAIADEAKRDDWDRMLSEPIDPIRFLDGEPTVRTDLLVRRRGHMPLVLDLKTGQGPASEERANSLLDEKDEEKRSPRDVARMIATEYDGKVKAQVLSLIHI